MTQLGLSYPNNKKSKISADLLQIQPLKNMKWSQYCTHPGEADCSGERTLDEHCLCHPHLLSQFTSRIAFLQSTRTRDTAFSAQSWALSSQIYSKPILKMKLWFWNGIKLRFPLPPIHKHKHKNSVCLLIYNGELFAIERHHIARVQG